MNIRLLLISFLSTCLLVSCGEEAENQQLAGTWVGIYQHKKKQQILPDIYAFYPDSSFEIYRGATHTWKKGRWELSANLLTLGAEKWNIFFKKGGKLNMRQYRAGKQRYLMFKRAESSSQLLEPPAIIEELKNSPWTSINEIPLAGFCRQDIHSFTDSSLVIRRNYFYDAEILPYHEVEAHCFRLIEMQGNQFLYMRNGANCELQQAPRQILQLNDRQLALLSYFHDPTAYKREADLHHLFYLALEDSQNLQLQSREADYFRLCEVEQNQLTKEKKPVAYAADQAKREYILDRFVDFPNSQSGTIEIYVMVDCHGKAGRLNIFQYDTNNQPINFYIGIIQQLFGMCTALTYAKNEFIQADSRRIFTFTIKEGALIDVRVRY